MGVKYQPGDVVGSYGMTLVEHATKNGRAAGVFKCGRCGRLTTVSMSNVVTGHAKSCGCRSQSVPQEVRKRCGQMGAATMTKADRLAYLVRVPLETLRENGRRNGKINVAKMPREAKQRGGLRSTFDNSKKKREYRGVTFRNSWELVVAISLTKAGLAYEYEQHTFDGYTPDFYVPQLDLWLEIKGRAHEIGMRKFEGFAKVHNARLLRFGELLQLYPQTKEAHKLPIEQIESGVRPFVLPAP